MAMEECYARSYCSAFGNDAQCNYECVAYHQMNRIFEMSNLPRRYRYELPLRPDGIDKPSFRELRDWITVEKLENGKYRHHIVDKIKNGMGLFLWSENKGNGKTSWAAKIMQAYFRAVGVSNNLRPRGIFINVPELLESMRRNMDNSTVEHTEMMKNLLKVDMVIFDDIGTESPTAWVREQLYILINKRYSEGLCNIFTSNLGLDRLGHDDLLGDRIASRINGSCRIIEFSGSDKRETEKAGRAND